MKMGLILTIMGTTLVFLIIHLHPIFIDLLCACSVLLITFVDWLLVIGLSNEFLILLQLSAEAF